ncbi:MAG: hypothetical protein ACR2MN_14565 [Acidimicrobiales bacterium]
MHDLDARRRVGAQLLRGQTRRVLPEARPPYLHRRRGRQTRQAAVPPRAERRNPGGPGLIADAKAARQVRKLRLVQASERAGVFDDPAAALWLIEGEAA